MDIPGNTLDPMQAAPPADLREAIARLPVEQVVRAWHEARRIAEACEQVLAVHPDRSSRP